MAGTAITRDRRHIVGYVPSASGTVGIEHLQANVQSDDDFPVVCVLCSALIGNNCGRPWSWTTLPT